MQILEQRVPIGAGQFVEALDRALGVVGADLGPGDQHRRGQVGDGASDRLRDMRVGGGILFQLDGAHTGDKAGDTVGLVDEQNALGEAPRFLDVAFGENRDESAIEQFGILRIGAQCRAVIGGGGCGVALRRSVAGGEIIAGGRNARHIPQRTLREQYAGQGQNACGQDGNGGHAPVRHRKDHECLHHAGRRIAQWARCAAFSFRMAFLVWSRKDGPKSWPNLGVAVGRYRDAAIRQPSPGHVPAHDHRPTYWDNSARRRLPAEPS